MQPMDVRVMIAGFAALISTEALAQESSSVGRVPSLLGDKPLDREQHVLQLQTRAFEPAWLEGLERKDVAGAAGFEAASLGVDPALLVMFDAQQAESVRALAQLVRLGRQYPGLRIAAIYDGADAAAAQARMRAVRAPLLLVPDDRFETLRRGVEPPVYVLVDRAGTIRHVASEADGLAELAQVLVAESVDEAKATMADRKAAADEARNAAKDDLVRRAPDDAGGAPVAADPAARPSIADYRNAAWPKHTNARELSAKNFQGKKLPSPLGSEKWLSDKPEGFSFEDRVLVLDFWATWCGPCIAASPKLDAIHKQYEGRLAVLAIGGMGDDEAKIRAHMKGHPVSYHHLLDAEQRLANAMDVKGIPHVVILSTDGVIRWQGNPHTPAFAKAVEAVVKADPLLARRGEN